jgi:hypothetical protein
MSRRLALVFATALFTAGCAGLFSASSTDPLAQAEGRMAAGEYRSALTLYDEFLKTHPDDSATARARATRAALDRLLAVQVENDRLRQELDRLLAVQGENDRLRRELERLRADLERLRNIDLRQAPPSR